MIRKYRAVLDSQGNTVELFIDGVSAQPVNAKLGDKIEKIAVPIARAIDRIAGTKIAGCGGCKKMKRRLNSGMGLGEALKKRIKGI